MRAGERRDAARLGTLCVTLFAAFAMLAAAPLPSAWKHWRYSRAIEVPPTDGTRLVSIVAPLEIYSRSKPRLADVRVIDDQGVEIPYVSFREAGTSNTVSLPSTLRENSFTGGQFTQLVVDLSAHAPFHDALRIETSKPDFIEWVQVEASDDGHLWRMVQERAPIFRFRKDNHQGTQVVHYSENNAQYLRVRILDGDAKFPVGDVNVSHEVVEPAERTPMGITLSPDANPAEGRSVWSADVGATAALATEVRFAVESPAEFIRSVNVSSSADGKDWETFDSAEIYRYRRGDAQLEKLSVAFPYAALQARYLLVEIVNGNDAPLSGSVPQLYITPQHIAFEQRPGRSYRLIYGQERAEDAEYDLVRRVTAAQMAAAVAGQTGPEEVNTDWVDPRAWTETHDMFLWVLMLAAVLLIGYAAVRSLRKSGRVPEA
ncbi:MAG: DUF3999 family protein [Candidatus Acidiferrales bacterium]